MDILILSEIILIRLIIHLLEIACHSFRSLIPSNGIFSRTAPLLLQSLGSRTLTFSGSQCSLLLLFSLQMYRLFDRSCRFRQGRRCNRLHRRHAERDHQCKTGSRHNCSRRSPSYPAAARPGSLSCRCAGSIRLHGIQLGPVERSGTFRRVAVEAILHCTEPFLIFYILI